MEMFSIFMALWWRALFSLVINALKGAAGKLSRNSAATGGSCYKCLN
jgi:predicted secreted protein